MDSTPASHESRFLNRGLLKIASIDELKAGVIKTLDDYQGKSGKVADVKLLEAVFEFALDQRNVAVEILTCSTFEALHDLSDRYRYTLLVPIRAGGGKSPLSENSSRTFGELDSIVKDLLEVPRGFDRQIMRELVLHRDNYRCALTGTLDMNSIESGMVSIVHDRDRICMVQTAHILPFSLASSSDDQQTIKRCGRMWQVIEGFSGIKPDELDGQKINRPENGIALDPIVRQKFGNLTLCLEPTDITDTYRVMSWYLLPAIQLMLPETVTFQARDRIPTPDRRYLALHAACCKIVHQAGMREVLDKLCRDLGSTGYAMH